LIKKIILIVATIVVSFHSMAQQNETCESPVESVLLDENSITKCSIEDTGNKSNKRSRTFTVQVSSRRKVVRKRKAVSSNSNIIKANKINEVSENKSIAGSLNLKTEDAIEKIPFNFVEEIPLFKACEKVSLLKQKECFNSEMNKHIISNFKYPEEAYNKSIQGRVLVQFVIDKTGDVTDLSIRVPYQGDILGEEAIRIVEKLPRFIPGKQNREEVKVKYGVPINFRIPGKLPSNVKKVAKKIPLKEVYNFTNVDEIPLFKKCSFSNDSSEECFNKMFINHINKYFAYPLKAVEKNIEGKVIAYFVIDSNGEIINIETKASSGKEILENATKELIEKLPNFIPGKQNGKKTNVKHSFPVMFKLSDDH